MIDLNTFALSESLQSYAREVFSASATYAEKLNRILADGPLAAEMTRNIRPPTQRLEP